ncbi:MAG: hypothetical protein K2N38_04840 [Oscillospiraceae bacterium]|nr:hypothetical protein [Oscillospiraceae bacterium]
MKINAKALKPLRVIAAVVAFAMIAGLLLFADSLLGNPVSYFIVKSNAKKYVAENHPGEGYVLESVNYSFKDGTYLAHFSTPDVEYSHFSVNYDRTGKMRYDYYTRLITDGGNIRTELEMEYRRLVDSALERPDFPYDSDMAYGTLIFEGDSRYDFGIPNSALAPDSTRDITELGRQAGVLNIYILSDDLSAAHAAEVLLEIKEFTEGTGVPFHAVELTLESSDGGYYNLSHILSDDIGGDGLVELVEENHRKTEEYYAELDAKQK